MPWIIGGIGLVGDLASSFMGSSSAHQANKANIKLAREQRAWEEKMSNTATQRRVNDIRMAGGNPALAFTGGQSASTPSMSAPTVEPTFRPEWMKGSAGTAAMLSLQTENLKAQTFKTLQEGRVNKVEADIRETLRGMEKETRANRFGEQYKWDNLKTHILQNASTSTAAQAKVKEETIDELIKIIQQQAKAGEFDLAGAANEAGMQESWFGEALPYIREFLGITGEGIRQFRGISPAERIWKKKR